MALNFYSSLQQPLALTAARKTNVRTQFAALCYRLENDKPKILLITSRRSGRWIAPKGWPIPGKTPAASALREAYEEAGVRGREIDQCLGVYSYNKLHASGAGLPCLAMVFPVRVDDLLDEFPEQGQRQRKWFGRKKAAAMVQSPELSQIIRRFDPRKLDSVHLPH